VLAREIEEESRGRVILPVGTGDAFYSRGGVLLADTWVMKPTKQFSPPAEAAASGASVVR
jgi:hypothetical protein